MAIAGYSNDVKMAKDELRCEFHMTDLGEMKRFLGMEIERDRQQQTITIRQTAYIEGLLTKNQMQNASPQPTPIATNYQPHKRRQPEKPANTQQYQSVVGSLIYAANITRPDIAAAVGIAGQYMSDPSESHWQGVKRILRAGYIIKLGLGAVIWGSKKQQVVALSSSEAEYMALSILTREVLWARQFLKELGYEQTSPTVVHEDNRGCIFIANENATNYRSKHIDIRHHFIRESIRKGHIELKACGTDRMVADCLTKGVSRLKNDYCCDEIGLK
ncbi:DNA-directed DNA polymerase [Synchytrium endobioticum]|uniref:DNA-directed DNA polymerase n=1 Tax=Synchytrium endobioticum TaxID=286115 RepID=A0A507D130_9FUNG|nr:DNA-directed DNA polymerase [Synchytrium endobioticum]